MIQYTFKSLKTIKFPTACFIVRIIRGKLPYSNKIVFKLDSLTLFEYGSFPVMILTVKQAVRNFIVFKLLKVY